MFVEVVSCIHSCRETRENSQGAIQVCLSLAFKRTAPIASVKDTNHEQSALSN